MIKKWKVEIGIGLAVLIGFKIFRFFFPGTDISAYLQTIANGVIALFTYRLWVSTRVQSDQTQQSLQMTREGLDLTRASQRAYLFVVPLEHNTREWLAGNDPFGWAFKVWNHGTTPAVVKEISAAVTIARTPPLLPDQDRHAGQADEYASTTVLRPMTESPFILSSGSSSIEYKLDGDHAPLDMTQQLPDAVRAKRTFLRTHASPASPETWFWMRCVVRYDDVYGESHVTAACFYLNPGHRTFSEQSGPGMNFRT